MDNNSYCVSLGRFVRRKSLAVSIGGTPLGGDNPVRVQTMTTTNTNSTEATAEQCIRAFEAGAEYVRITAQGVKEAANLQNIQKELQRRGYRIPLVADIHFTPSAAIEAARHVDKVRINPGNFAEPKAGPGSASRASRGHAEELARIEETLLPLVELCRQRGVALRVGVNHGSLSGRIMDRYGDTPEGMVQSALEFLRICQKQGFNQVVVSMKSSNTRVMVHAVRLLVNRMDAEGMSYPLHLGVTEAGDGEDGRIKSAVGIGALLADGIGDTVRVSLTEEPEQEIPAARKLVDYFGGRASAPEVGGVTELPYNPFEYKRRETFCNVGIGGDCPPVVVADLSRAATVDEKAINGWGWYYSGQRGCWERGDVAADYFLVLPAQLSIPAGMEQLPLIHTDSIVPLADLRRNARCTSPFIRLRHSDLEDLDSLELLRGANSTIILEAASGNGYAEQRAAFVRLMEGGVTLPVIVSRHYPDTDKESFQLKSAADVGALLIDGLGDGVMLTAPSIADSDICATAFAILQAARARVSKTEYIACPGCGRTLFNLQQTLQRVKAATARLRGLKIGVMGCIVNGPGEMADADYGYVGAGPNRVTLYKGKTVVKRNIPEANAIEELIGVIKENGDWRE